MRPPVACALLLLALVAAGCVGPSQPWPLTASSLPLKAIDPARFAQGGPWSVPLQPGPFHALPVQLVRMPSFDVTPISLGVYLPDVPNGTKVPALIDSSPYYGNGEGPVDHLTGDRLSKFLVENLVPHGYAVVLMSVRGTGDSGGCNDFFGPAETADIGATINWSAGQPWSSGSVALIGKSYDGGTAWQGAATGNPHLKTIVPLSGVSSMRALHLANGTAETRTPILWAAYAEDNVPATGLPAPLPQGTDERSTDSAVSGLVCPEVEEGLAASTTSTLTGDSSDALGFWAARDAAPLALQRYHGSLFVEHGLQDWNVHPDQAFPLFDEFHGTKKLLLGQWEHSYPDRPKFNAHATRWDFAETLLRWLDRELKGLLVDTGPVVDVEDNTGRWRTEDAWPPADARLVTWHLSGDGKLQPQAGTEGQFLIENPENTTGHAASTLGLPALDGMAHADFASAPVDRDLRLSGMPQVPLRVTPLGPGGHVGAELLDEAPNGSLLRVGHGTIDVRAWAGGDALQTVVPGQPLTIQLQLYPLDALVPQGHRLVLRVAQDVDANLAPTPLSFPIQLNVGGEASLLKLPMLERSAAQLAGGWPYGPTGRGGRDGP